MNIFQLNQELLSIFEELEENGGELTSEIEEQLKINQTDVNNKVESYTQVIAQLNSDIELIKSEKKRLDDLKLSKEKTKVLRNSFFMLLIILEKLLNLVLKLLILEQVKLVHVNLLVLKYQKNMIN